VLSRPELAEKGHGRRKTSVQTFGKRLRPGAVARRPVWQIGASLLHAPDAGGRPALAGTRDSGGSSDREGTTALRPGGHVYEKGSDFGPLALGSLSSSRTVLSHTLGGLCSGLSIPVEGSRGATHLTALT
jgi:hypothetical protein